MMGIVLLGPPGVGKGTQAKRLQEALGLLHLSTGEVLRQEVSAGTALGKRVSGVMASGALVADELVGEVVETALEKGLPPSSGYLLDGFPRTLRQVEILDSLLRRARRGLDHAVLIDAAEPLLVRRLTGRRVCDRCGALYHTDGKPPSSPGICDACGGVLVQRKDDHENVVTERLRVYREQTSPVLEAYGGRGLLRRIDGSGSSDEVFALIISAIGGVRV